MAVFPENFDAVAVGSLPAGWTDAAANCPSNCTGTNIASNDGVNTVIWLRTPSIDLTASTEGTLALEEFRDLETIPVIDLGSDM